MLKVSIFLTRRADLTHDEFVTYWTQKHTPLLATYDGVAEVGRRDRRRRRLVHVRDLHHARGRRRGGLPRPLADPAPVLGRGPRLQLSADNPPTRADVAPHPPPRHGPGARRQVTRARRGREVPTMTTPRPTAGPSPTRRGLVGAALLAGTSGAAGLLRGCPGRGLRPPGLPTGPRSPPRQHYSHTAPLREGRRARDPRRVDPVATHSRDSPLRHQDQGIAPQRDPPGSRARPPPASGGSPRAAHASDCRRSRHRRPRHRSWCGGTFGELRCLHRLPVLQVGQGERVGPSAGAGHGRPALSAVGWDGRRSR